jgi:hypothetical protein
MAGFWTWGDVLLLPWSRKINQNGMYYQTLASLLFFDVISLHGSVESIQVMTLGAL